MLLFVEVDRVVLLVVQSDTGFILADSLVGECLEEIGPLVDNNVVLLVGIILIFQLEVVGGKLLDGQIGSANGSLK